MSFPKNTHSERPSLVTLFEIVKAPLLRELLIPLLLLCCFFHSTYNFHIQYKFIIYMFTVYYLFIMFLVFPPQQEGRDFYLFHSLTCLYCLL